MKRSILFFLLAAAFPLSASADSIFDGTWKANESSLHMTKKPFVVVVMDGIYDCKFCVPEIKVKADGTDQPVTGHPYYDTVAVKIIDAHTVQVTEKKGGKVVFAATETVSADGKTFTNEFTDSTATSGAPTMTTFTALKQ